MKIIAKVEILVSNKMASLTKAAIAKKKLDINIKKVSYITS